MSVIATALKHMLAAGLPADAIIAAVAEMETAMQQAVPQTLAKKRERDRIRMRTKRAEDGDSRATSRESDDIDDTLSLPPSPQTPQPPTHTRECVSTHTRETADFEVFWEAYPNRVAKPAARKAFAKARPKVADVEVLIAAVERQRDWDAWQRGFIPHPATWLNQERWTDEQPQSPKAHVQSRQDRPQSRRDEDLGTMLSGALVALDRRAAGVG